MFITFGQHPLPQSDFISYAIFIYIYVVVWASTRCQPSGWEILAVWTSTIYIHTQLCSFYFLSLRLSTSRPGNLPKRLPESCHIVTRERHIARARALHSSRDDAAICTIWAIQYEEYDMRWHANGTTNDIPLYIEFDSSNWWNVHYIWAAPSERFDFICHLYIYIYIYMCIYIHTHNCMVFIFFR